MVTDSSAGDSGESTKRPALPIRTPWARDGQRYKRGYNKGDRRPEFGSFAYEDEWTVEQKLRRWQTWTLVRQRNISSDELRVELGGISRARLHQMMIDVMLGATAPVDRIERAVEKITERRHAASCVCTDYAHAIYVAAYATDTHMVQAKQGAMGDWRTQWQNLLTPSE